MPLVAQLYDLAMEHADKLTPAVIAAMAPATIVVYFVCLIFYRLWLHPLSSIPGPFWNRITFLAEFHYNSTMYKKIDEWHKKYGKFCLVLATLLEAVFSTGRVVR